MGKSFSYAEMWQRLTPLYEAGEAKAIVRTLMEEHFDMSLSDLLCDGTSRLDADQQTELEAMMQRLEKTDPLQYVLGEAWFMGRRLYVEPGVLIPRPETEVLCQWVIERQSDARRVLDIGCGSGCIAISLALALPSAAVTAWDISSKALDVTRRNASALRAEVSVEQHDVLNLDVNNKQELGRWDVIVSNPPYICESEAAAMHPNVVRHEPSLALFVPDTDPLLFYSVIARYATGALREGGALFFECHEGNVEQVAALLRQQYFTDVETRQDQFGKPRFVCGCIGKNTYRK